MTTHEVKSVPVVPRFRIDVDSFVDEEMNDVN